jgi:hypothetical protein
VGSFGSLQLRDSGKKEAAFPGVLHGELSFQL